MLSLLLGADLLKPLWKENSYIRDFQDRASNGGKEISGPLLVVHGEADPILNVQLSVDAVGKTSKQFPQSQLELVTLPNVTHVPASTASQRLWMDWVGNRFAGIDVEPRCVQSTIQVARPVSSYQAELDWFLESATQFYHTP